MHEMDIAQSILESAEETLRQHPGAKLAKVNVRVGELAGIDRESLSFCFEVLTRDTALAGVVLEVDWRPLTHQCLGCEREFTVVDWKLDCPSCGSGETRFRGGDELEVAYLELEEP
ncbi:MAG: hydrogenase maturation nickel metallochaperone HypA [Bryobacteraceae bacterium]